MMLKHRIKTDDNLCSVCSRTITATTKEKPTNEKKERNFEEHIIAHNVMALDELLNTAKSTPTKESTTPASDNSVKDSLYYAVVFIVNYTIVAKIARDLRTTHSDSYALSLTICLFFLTFCFQLIRAHWDKTIYLIFILFVLLCVYVK